MGNVHDGDGIVVENCRHIFRGELIRCIADEETCLSNGTVTDDYAPADNGLALCCFVSHDAIADRSMGHASQRCV